MGEEGEYLLHKLKDKGDRKRRRKDPIIILF